MFHYDEEDATVVGEFTDGNPSLNIGRTILRARWLNMVQRELLDLVSFSGLTPDKNVFTQTRQAVIRLAQRFANPIGCVKFHYGATAPDLWLELDGSLKSRANYPRLWQHVQAEGLTVSEASWSGGAKGKFSVGNGSTNFRLPDLRDEFLRVWANGRDGSSRTLGSLQSDNNKEHSHLVASDAFDGPGAHATPLTSSRPLAKYGLNSSGDSAYYLYGDPTTGAEANVGRSSTAGVSEARPRNVAIMAIVFAGDAVQ